MKVVLFCGGLGTRLREHSETIPKPLVSVGYRPIIWHLMRYYSHYGYKDFVLALGYRGDMIREYFLNYKECMSNDFVLSEGGKKIEVMDEDTADWRITFVDTGLHSNLGQRLSRVRKYVQDEEEFLVNYSDGLSDLNLAAFIEESKRRDAIASFVSVRPSQSFHARRSAWRCRPAWRPGWCRAWGSRGRPEPRARRCSCPRPMRPSSDRDWILPHWPRWNR